MTNKKLIEVSIPVDLINDASSYDKMPGIGPHPKGIHHWWAPLPLPCARTLLFASLVDDPGQDVDRRKAYFNIIAGLCSKDSSALRDALSLARKEISKTDGAADLTVYDPFSGGGSIPLEAQRLGLNVLGSELNPVAALKTFAQIELVPRFVGRRSLSNKNDVSDKYSIAGLAEDLDHYGKKIFTKVSEMLRQYYPTTETGARPIAWIWARTVTCPNPACQKQAPLVRSFVLASKGGQKTWLAPQIDKSGNLAFTVESGTGQAQAGTMSGRQGAKCIFCKAPVPIAHIREQGRAKRLGVRLLAFVTSERNGRKYHAGDLRQETAADVSIADLDLPDTELPAKALGFRIQSYGFKKHSEMFTARQLMALTKFSDAIREIHATVMDDYRREYPREDDLRPLSEGGAGPRAYADAIALLLGFVLDRCADFNSAFCTWLPSNQKVMHLFGRAAVPMIWDFAEAAILENSVGGWITCLEHVRDCLKTIPLGGKGNGARIEAGDARETIGKLSTPVLVSTDPPYYDNIGYADLSDFFYVWLRRSVGPYFPKYFSTTLVPKVAELVASPERFDDDAAAAKRHFEGGFKDVFSGLRRTLDNRFPMTVYYAFKQEDSDDGEDDEGTAVDLTTGWETLLNALIDTGFQVTATWPIRASQKWRMRAIGSNALASYIVLACRPRPTDASTVTRKEFLRALRNALPDAIQGLRDSRISPVDLAQAAIGPGMAVFSQYASVLESDDSRMSVRTALSIINQFLDECLSESDSELDSLSRWAVAWFENFGTNEGTFGDANTLAQAKNVSVETLVASGIATARAGKVALISRPNLDVDWEPKLGDQPIQWLATQHLIKRLEVAGESEAGRLLKALGSTGELCRNLAYRCFSICERKGWTQDAIAFNSLVVSWTGIQREALNQGDLGPQGNLGV